MSFVCVYACVSLLFRHAFVSAKCEHAHLTCVCGSIRAVLKQLLLCVQMQVFVCVGVCVCVCVP